MTTLTRNELIMAVTLTHSRIHDLGKIIDDQAERVSKSEAGSDEYRLAVSIYRADLAYRSDLQNLADKLDKMIDEAHAAQIVGI